jgi:hypothetical protein
MELAAPGGNKLLLIELYGLLDFLSGWFRDELEPPDCIYGGGAAGQLWGLSSMITMMAICLNGFSFILFGFFGRRENEMQAVGGPKWWSCAAGQECWPYTALSPLNPLVLTTTFRVLSSRRFRALFDQCGCFDS